MTHLRWSLKKYLQKTTNYFNTWAIINYSKPLTRASHETVVNDVKILDIETRWLQRGAIKEAYYNAALDQDLNQDKGHHTLSPVYASIIKKSCDWVSTHASHSLPLFSTSDEISRM